MALVAADDGSIPACAGEPRLVCQVCQACKVYPRVCGGTGLVIAPLLMMAGLSPRVRGNHPVAGPAEPFRGSIPACAGEPFSPWAVKLPGAVYPRVCGGTDKWAVKTRIIYGLSPRVRGNRGPAPAVSVTHGSIPACAGEPPRGGGCPVAGEVYPRVCGGTAVERRPR